jgi:hypothetical protein
MANKENTMPGGAAKTKYLEYTEEAMRECLLAFCMCADPATKVGSIIQEQACKNNGKAVASNSLYRHFKKRVDLGADRGGSTSLKEIQQSVRVFSAANPSSCSEGNKQAMEDFKGKAVAVIEQIFKTKKENQKVQQSDLHRSNCVLTSNEEKALVQLVKYLGVCGHGLDRMKILDCLNHITRVEGTLSQKAVSGFLKRSPELKLVGSSGIDSNRASQANENVRDIYFCKLDNFVGVLHGMGRSKQETFADIPSQYIYNMDEVASDTTKRRNKIAVDSEVKTRVFTITPEGDKMPFHVTICLTTRADGQFISPGEGILEGAPPPVVIHSKPETTKKALSNKKAPATSDPCKLSDKHVQGLCSMKGCTSALEAYEKNNEDGFLVMVTHNGSMKQSTMLPYAKHFVKHLPADRDPLQAVILLLDGHSSRWDLDALIFLYQHKVYCFFFPSHASIWSQCNDLGPNQSIHKCIADEASEQRSIICVSGRYTIVQYNVIFRGGYRRFLQKERADFIQSGSNTTTNSYFKSGIKPFNPRCQSWTEAISGLGISSTEQNQRFRRSFEVKVLALVVVLDEKEIQQLFKEFTESSVVETERDKIVRASICHGRAMLARFRERFEATRRELLQSIQVASPQDISDIIAIRNRDESDFNPEQKDLLRQLQRLHPAEFAISEGDRIALKVISFIPCDIDALPKPAMLSEKQKRLQYVRTVLDQKAVGGSVQVQKLADIEGQFIGVLSTGTATKIETYKWKLLIPEGPSKVLEIEMTTQALAESEGYNVVAESLALESTEKQKRQQRESQKRRRKEEERLREQEATAKAKQGRDEMLHKEYEKLAGTVASGLSYEKAEFFELVKKVNEPFACQVVVNGHVMTAFANNHEAGALNYTMQKSLTDQLFSGGTKRLLDGGNTERPQKKGRFVATRLSEDGLVAIEDLERHDSKADREQRKKQYAALNREKGSLEKLQADLKKLQKNQGQNFFDVQASDVKSHVKLMYRLFDGPNFSAQSLPDMKKYLSEQRVDSPKAQDKLAALDERVSKLSDELDVLGRSLIELIDEEEATDANHANDANTSLWEID